MSHCTVIDTHIASAEHLVRALRDVGFTDVEVHEEAQPLIGFLGDRRNNLAHVIVRQCHVGLCSNDMGFLQTSSGYFKAQISESDRARFDHGWLDALTQRYAYHVARDMLARRNFEMTEETCDRDGTIHLAVRRISEESVEPVSGAQEIEALIRPNGQVRVRVRGMKGAACMELTGEMERYLGGRLRNREQEQMDERADHTPVG